MSELDSKCSITNLRDLKVHMHENLDPINRHRSWVAGLHPVTWLPCSVVPPETHRHCKLCNPSTNTAVFQLSSSKELGLACSKVPSSLKPAAVPRP